jgi:hypothetical protein
MMEAVSSTEIPVNIYQTTWHIPSNSRLHTHGCDNMNFQELRDDFQNTTVETDLQND